MDDCSPPCLPPLGSLVFRSEFTELVADSLSFDYHVDISPEAEGDEVDTCLGLLAMLGLELIPEDEDEPRTLDNGWTRIYTVPVEPVDDIAEPEPSVGLTLRKRIGAGTAGVAAVALSAAASAAFHLSPVMDALVA